MKNTKNIIVQLCLIVAIVVLILLIYRSVMRPQKFNVIYEGRKAEVVTKLKDIRVLQQFYKAEKGSYAKNFDQLRDFWNNGTMTVVVKEGNVPDTLTEAQALKMGIIKRDTVLVKAKDEMLKSLPNFDIEKFDLIPFSGGERFIMDADTITRANIPVYVYEVRANKSQYLKNMDNDPRVKNAFLGSILYSGLQEQFLGPNFDYKENIKDIILGSLTEPSTDGNWE
ncbi:MAG: hypothetical protein J5701_00445 [Bacteroidales bacterium]|nr:hypothetical protein [Bacteroidales bacterium]